MIPKQRGLRFDKVALRLITRLQTTLRDEVPEGKALLVTVSAPIRLPAKTASALEERVRLELAGLAKAPEFHTTINGNEICVRIVSCAANRTPNVLGFVHNPDVDTLALLNSAQSTLAD